MNFKLIGFILALVHFTTTAYSINYKLLDQESDTHFNRIVRKEPIDSDRIRKTMSLSILRPDETVGEEYKTPNIFESFCNDILAGISDDTFKGFISVCMSLYKEGEIKQSAQIILHLLVKLVKEKYDNHSNLLARLEARKKVEASSQRKDPPEVQKARFNFIMHMDTANAPDYLDELKRQEEQAGISVESLFLL